MDRKGALNVGNEKGIVMGDVHARVGEIRAREKTCSATSVRGLGMHTLGNVFAWNGKGNGALHGYMYRHIDVGRTAHIEGMHARARGKRRGALMVLEMCVSDGGQELDSVHGVLNGEIEYR